MFVQKKISLVFIVTLCLNRVTTQDGILYAISPQEVTGIFGKNAILEYGVNYTGYNLTDPKTKSFMVELKETSEVLATGGSAFFNLHGVIPENFTERLTTAYVQETNSYRLTVGPLRYTDDNLVFEGVLFYTVENDNNKASSTTELITLIVKGGPALCGPALEPLYNGTVGGNLSMSLILCGNPDPRLSLEFNGNQWNVGDRQNISVHKYKYNIKLTNLESNLCGKTLKYTASGHGSDLIGETKINVNFSTDATNIRATRDELELCITIKWDDIDTGDCEKISYEPRFYDINGSLINTTDSLNNTFNNTYIYCLPTIGEAETISAISLLSTYNSVKANTATVAIVVIPKPTSPPPTLQPTTTKPPPTISTITITTTTSTTKGTGKQTGIDDDNTTLIAAVAGGVGGLVFVIIIIVICCVCCKDKDKNKKKDLQMSSIHEYDDKSKIENLTSDRDNKSNLRPSADATLENGVAKDAKDREVEEYVSSAKLRYYDPNEFDIKPSNGYSMISEGAKGSPPQTPAAPPTGEHTTEQSSIAFPVVLPHDKVNKSYDKDEFDSDDDTPYENYDPKHGVNPTLTRKN